MGLPPRNSGIIGEQHMRRVHHRVNGVQGRVEKVERAISPRALKATFPASTIDGAEFTYQPVEGIAWRFRYNASSASSYKWEFVGGPAWVKEVATSENTASAAAVDLATVGPTFASVLPAGEYIVRAYCVIANATAAATRGVLTLDNNGADTTLTQGTLATTNYYLALADETVATIAASTTVKLQYSSTAASSVAFLNRRLSMTPIRCT
jgi:hypothetical protein